MSQANRWNRIIYACWSPFYDLLIQIPALVKARRRAFEGLALKAGERICLIGVGTGADFALLPEGSVAVGIDLSEPMLARARRKLPLPGRDITVQAANAESLPFPDASFDVAVLSLIVSVAADGAACMAEATRVVRPGGRLLVFDKFLRPNTRPSVWRRLLNLLTRPFGTDINRSFEPMIDGLPVRLVSDQAGLMRGAYRALLLERTA